MKGEDMEPEDDARLRLEKAMNERRNDLRLKWQEVAERAKISVPTLKRIRNGPGPVTAWAARGLEVALSWPQGEVFRILADEEQPAEQAEQAPRYPDPGLQAIWEADLPEHERLAAITLIEAMRSVPLQSQTNDNERRTNTG
ncbi:hypothetical protein [Streptosporangium carneum]|uniref:Uncharacterized protein n=1 Tax=Streptosporangium carneum TaxID=47481 RepID=A0A9W6MAN8_9ACTN|nr:hypothetical protein [Streptosporangium carneum]GLK07256.1 hypothetical protein GCM10017600_06610 [Streptosporangium carneum]